MCGKFRGTSTGFSLFVDYPNFETQDINRYGFARGINFVMCLHLHPYFMYANSDGSGESVHLPQLLNSAITSNISSAGPIIPFEIIITILKKLIDTTK